MLLRCLLWPLCLLYTCYFWVTSASSLSSRAVAVNVISPAVGDTIVVGSNFEIKWQNLTDNSVTLSLRNGTADNMTLLHVIATTPNNGSYEWRSRDDDYLKGDYPSLYGAPSSGCNYALEFRTGGDIINSGFFTILNVKDGGITANMSCPGGKIPGSSGSESSPEHTASSVSRGTLAGAVSGAFVGTILLTALMLLAMRKLGWIISKHDVEVLMENRLQGENSRMLPTQAPFDRDVPQVEGKEVHQMP